MCTAANGGECFVVDLAMVTWCRLSSHDVRAKTLVGQSFAVLPVLDSSTNAKHATECSS